MESLERNALIALASCPHVEPSTLRKLVHGLGSALAVWEANITSWKQVSNLRQTTADRLHAWRSGVDITRIESKLNERGITCIAQSDDDYPELLMDLIDSPLVLFVRGRASVLSQYAIAIVGTRRASGYGIEAAKWVSETVSNVGCTVVSGLALGIDAAAHGCAVERMGSTVAVLASGVDVCYPQSNYHLYGNIVKFGAVVSEYAPGSLVSKHRFPERNRLIAALSKAVVVVQAGEKSGALRTVDSALELGRDVYVVPGPITSIHFRGSHRLLQQGAAMLVDPKDLLTELDIPKHFATKATTTMTMVPERWQQVYECLEEPLSINQLFVLSGIPESALYAGLLELEISGLIKKAPGGIYQRM